MKKLSILVINQSTSSDFIEFKENYFKDGKGKEQKQYMAMCYQYITINTPTKEYLQFYDLLIEDKRYGN